MKSTFDVNARVATHTLLRVVTGLMFWQHGAQKLFGWLGGRQVQDLASLSGVAGVLEFVGGILIVIGLFTRPVAFILSGEMAFAYFLSHAPRALWPIENRGEPSVLFCFLFLFFAAHGAGPYSLDALLRRGRSTLDGPRTNPVRAA
jgi:putative oxidoreductase